MTSSFGLYVHIPFCPQRCPYCAFTVVTGHTELYDRYVAAVCAEICQSQHLVSRGPLQTIYVGGGTPSRMQWGQLQHILDAAETTLGIAADAEITLEANPSTADVEKFRAFRHTGCNRLSLGVQSFKDEDLRRLGRLHSAAEAEQACLIARQAGFTNLNLDVIFGIPGSPRAHWQYTVQTLLALQPEHISTYSLTFEEGTRLAQLYHQRCLEPVSEEDDAWAYAWARETLCQAGYQHYEVSNFARAGFRSRHNWGYWFGAAYMGVGLSAHSYVDGQRWWNTRDLQHYIATVESGQSPREGQEVIDSTMARHEKLWLQLRTCEGVQLDAAERHTLLQVPKFQAMLRASLVQFDRQRLRLTQHGFPLADAITLDVVDMLDT